MAIFSVIKYFNTIPKYGNATNKNFWNLKKSVLTNTGYLIVHGSRYIAYLPTSGAK